MLPTAQRELQEELGLPLEEDRFHFAFTYLERLASTQKGKPFINNEFNEVFVVSVTEEERKAWDAPVLSLAAPASAPLSEVEGAAGAAESALHLTSTSTSPTFALQPTEVVAVAWTDLATLDCLYSRQQQFIAPLTDWPTYRHKLFAAFAVANRGE